MLRYVVPTRQNLQFIADTMRQGDREELAAGGWSPEHLHDFAGRAEICVVAEVGGVPCAVFGVTRTGSLLTPKNSPWMLGGTELHKHTKLLLSESKKIVYTIVEEYREVENWVYAESSASIRWLKWLGFTVEDPVPLGPEGQEFCRFWKKRG